MAVLRSICVSELKGTQKHEVPQAELIEEWGVKGDAHAGNGTDRSACSALSRSRTSGRRARTLNSVRSERTS